MKYVDTLVSFSEIPDEITLCINISQCPNNCKGCHSPWLREDVGEDLNIKSLYNLINKNKGVTCVCFMGGDQDPAEISNLAFAVRLRSDYPYKTAWYSGKQHIPDELNVGDFDYIKVGPYIEEFGGLDNPNTNQRMYEVCKVSKLPEKFSLIDITNKFWKNESNT
jgi:anaerobic ribonucleoside-triphosphate reductase activating protein